MPTRWSTTPPGLRQGFVLARLGQTPPRKTSLHRDRPAPSLRLASSGRETPARAEALQYPATAADRGVRRLGHIPSSRCQATRRVGAAEAELFDVGHRLSHGYTVGFTPGVSRGFAVESLPVESLPVESLVEPDGIEPTTSCLQSRRSPN